MFKFIKNLFKTKQQKEVEKIAQEIINVQNDLLLENIKDMGRARFNANAAQDVRVHTYEEIVVPENLEELQRKNDIPVDKIKASDEETRKRKHPRYQND